jgi:4-aminobutyrate aminotransferase-like enzyme/Ser/Thr protein kinase RdoA (MazF antagonist)
MSSDTVIDRPLASPPPRIDAGRARHLLAEHYGIDAAVEALRGETEQIFRADAGDGQVYVLRIADADDGIAAVDMQIAALQHLAEAAPALPVARVLSAIDGALRVAVREGGRSLSMRVQTHLPGVPCLDVSPTPATRRAIGRLVADLDRGLAGFFHPLAGREIPWDLRHAAHLGSKIEFLDDARQRALARDVLDGYAARVAPLAPRLARQMIHNDVNQNNVLIDPASGEITGLLDFGDMVHSHRINELAIAVAHQLYRQDDPLAAGADVVGAYALIAPLEAIELDVLYDLVRARLASRELIAGWRHRTNPAAARYDAEVSRLGWDALQKWSDVGATSARQRFYAAAGVPLPQVSTAAVDDSERDAARAALAARRARMLGPMYKQFYQSPFLPVHAEGVWVTDDAGRRYLDGYNNVPHVGHCHPHVVAAVTRQMRLLNTHTRYLHQNAVRYAEQLAATLPDPLHVCLFVCSGTEANELAWRIALANTGGTGAIVTESAFHGNSTVIAELDTSTIPSARRQPWVAAVPAPAMAGHRPDRRHPDARAYAAHYDHAIAALAARGHRPAAFFACSVFASDGLYSPPAGYLAPAMARLKAAGALIVADEVQSGLGRPGTHMWGFEHAGFTPDIVTMGKPMGNGMPLAVVVTRRELLERFVETQRYFNTFGGNPVVCAAGLAVLEVMEREGLREHAQDVGAYLRDALAQLMFHHDSIGDVRGSGLFTGVELVEDRANDIAAPKLARDVIETMCARGVLIGLTGRERNLLKIRPPMVFTRTNADQLVDALDATLTQLRPTP